MLNTHEPTCPTCGGTLISTSHFDVENMDNGQIAMSVVGVCDHCGNQYEWVEWYSYIGYNCACYSNTYFRFIRNER